MNGECSKKTKKHQTNSKGENNFKQTDYQIRNEESYLNPPLNHHRVISGDFH